MDNKKLDIASKKIVYSISNCKRKAQTPNPPQSPKLEKKRKILGHLELYLSKAIKAGVMAYKYIETKLKSP